MKKLFVAAAVAAASAQPAFAQDADVAPAAAKQGVRIEARAIYETPTVSDVDPSDDVYKLGSAFAFGGEIGGDFAVSDRVTVGPYANYEISNVENCEGDQCVNGDYNWSAGLQLGYAVGDRGLAYVKAGYSELGLKGTVLVGNTLVDFKESNGGIGGAIGYEHGFGGTFYGRVEFGYADNGEIFGINFQRRHAGVALGARF